MQHVVLCWRKGSQIVNTCSVNAARDVFLQKNAGIVKASNTSVNTTDAALTEAYLNCE